MEFKKSQVSIFIIISLIIVILLSFLIGSDFSYKKSLVNTENIKLNFNKNSDLNSIKDKIDFCLERELRRGIIIAGYRGGFIYDSSGSNNHEYYSPGIILPSNIGYNVNLLRNLDINLNYLSSNVLVYSQESVYVPRLDDDFRINTDSGTKTIYSKSIKDDLDDFVFFNFLSCLDLDEFRNYGFDINYDRYVGKIDSINLRNNIIYSKDLEGDEGDLVKLSFGGRIHYGVIKKGLSISSLTKVDFSMDPIDGTVSNEDLYNSYLINLKANSYVNTSFEDEKITAKLYFPITISIRNGSTIKYSESSVVIENRFKELLLLANILMESKEKDRSLNLMDDDVLINIFKNSPALNGIDISTIQIIKTPINNSMDYKLFVYSLVDEKSKILGNSFIFNFAYENSAPRINFSNFGVEINEENSILMYVSKNQEFTLDLKPLTFDPQIFDNYVSFYHKYSYNGLDGKFSLDNSGIVNFIAYQEKRYSFPIIVDDGEAKRSINLVIITGFPDNKNNRIAKDCFRFENNEINDLFPIDEKYKNKLFSYVDGEKNVVYGYSHYFDLSKNYPLDVKQLLETKKSKLYLLKSCFYNSDLFEARYRIISDEGLVLDNGILGDDLEIVIPNKNYKLNVEVGIYDKNIGNLMTEIFKVSIYPVSCMGPNSVIGENYLKYGGSLSCCDLSDLRDDFNSNNPISLVGIKSNLLGNNEIVMNSDMYFCYTPSSFKDVFNPGNKNLFDYENRVIWDEIGGDATSLFRTNIEASCKGLYPVAFNNLDSFKGDLFLGYSSIIKYKTKFVDYSIPIKMSLEESGGVCNLCFIDNKSQDFSIIINRGSNSNPIYWELNGGFVFDNDGDVGYNQVGVSPLVSGFQNNLYLLTNKNWFNKEEDEEWKVSLPGIFYGEGKNINSISKGKYYCDLDSIIPIIRKDKTDVFEKKVDYSCIDYYIDGSYPNEIKSKPAPINRVCGTYISYENVVCKCDDNNELIFTYDEVENNLYCNSNGVCNYYSQQIPVCNLDCS